MFARSRFQIGPSKQLQNNRCLALRRPPSCARQRCRFRKLLSRPPGSFRSPGIGSLCVGHAFPPSEHFLYKISQRAVQRNSGPGDSLIPFKKTTSQTSDYLAGAIDYLLFYARSKSTLKYRQLFNAKELGGLGGGEYQYLVDNLG